MAPAVSLKAPASTPISPPLWTVVRRERCPAPRAAASAVKLADRRGDALGDEPGQQQRQHQHHAADHQVAHEVGARGDQCDLDRGVDVHDPRRAVGDGVPDDAVVGGGRAAVSFEAAVDAGAPDTAAGAGGRSRPIERRARQQRAAHVDDRDGRATRQAPRRRSGTASGPTRSARVSTTVAPDWFASAREARTVRCDPVAAASGCPTTRLLGRFGVGDLVLERAAGDLRSRDRRARPPPRYVAVLAYAAMPSM